MAYGGFKDFPRRTAFDKVLHDKALYIANNSKYDELNVELLQSFINVLIKILLLVVVLKVKLL